MRVAVMDIGSNSTRLLIADASRKGSIKELLRRYTGNSLIYLHLGSFARSQTIAARSTATAARPISPC